MIDILRQAVIVALTVTTTSHVIFWLLARSPEPAYDYPVWVWRIILSIRALRWR